MAFATPTCIRRDASAVRDGRAERVGSPGPSGEFDGASIYELGGRRARTTAARDERHHSAPGGSGAVRDWRTRSYALSWEGAGTDVAAGEVTIAVEPPAYRFVVTAATAPWIKRFFEARDE